VFFLSGFRTDKAVGGTVYDKSCPSQKGVFFLSETVTMTHPCWNSNIKAIWWN